MSSLNRKRSMFDLYIFTILIASELLMSFTFLGYIHIPPVSITFAYIPILIAAASLGTAQSTAIGFVFGLASMYKASASYVMPMDKIFSPFYSGRPLQSFILSIGTRTLFGFIIGLSFAAVKKTKKPRLYIGIISFIAPKLHDTIVYATMELFFSDVLRENIGNAKLFGIKDILPVVLSVLSAELTMLIYNSRTVIKLKKDIDKSYEIPYISTKSKNIFLTVLNAFVLIMTLLSTMYFASRSLSMFEEYGMKLSSQVERDLIRLQLQFMLAMLSLYVISLVILIFVYRKMAYQNFLGKLDAVTGVMGRRIFLENCAKITENMSGNVTDDGWFLFADIDKFKNVNDTFGHAVGDLVLKETARLLGDMFLDCGIVGRMGGDEFAVLISERTVTQNELSAKLDILLSELSNIIPEKCKISCSIGACHFAGNADVNDIAKFADRILYEAKNKGRACYVLGEYSAE